MLNFPNNCANYGPPLWFLWIHYDMKGPTNQSAVLAWIQSPLIKNMSTPHSSLVGQEDFWASTILHPDVFIVVIVSKVSLHYV